MVNMTASYFATHFPLEATSDYQAPSPPSPAMARQVFWHTLESIHKILFMIERFTLI